MYTRAPLYVSALTIHLYKHARIKTVHTGYFIMKILTSQIQDGIAVSPGKMSAHAPGRSRVDEKNTKISENIDLLGPVSGEMSLLCGLYIVLVLASFV